MDRENDISKVEDEHLKEAIKNVLGRGDTELIDIDDTFDFQCQQCGQCCMNRKDIVMNPFDVYQIAKHEQMSPEDVIDKYMIVDLGANSKIPMVLLDCDQEPNHWCPFLKLDVTKGCKFFCTIHDCSPGACQNHPIGTMYSYDVEHKIENTRYCKVEQCENSKGHNNPVKVRDWVKRYNDNIREITLAHKIQTLVIEYFQMSDFMILASYLDRCITEEINSSLSKGTPEENDEIVQSRKFSNIINQSVDAIIGVTVGVGYTQYDITKPFYEQAENNIKELGNAYQHFKELYESFRHAAGVPDDEKDIKKWILHDCIKNGLLDKTNIPPETIQMIKEKVEKGEV